MLIALGVILVGAGLLLSVQTIKPSAAALPLLLAGLILIAVSMAHARDDGRYANSALKPWFDSLRSGKGPCCSDADGYALSDIDWETSTDGKHYRVRIPRYQDEPNDMVWVDVPDEAVITEPNRAGRTMVWPIWGNEPQVRCFMPGSMT